MYESSDSYEISSVFFERELRRTGRKSCIELKSQKVCWDKSGTIVKQEEEKEKENGIDISQDPEEGESHLRC